MTKSELIKELEKVPDDANLYLLDEDFGYFNEVGGVSTVDAFTQSGDLKLPHTEAQRSVAVKIWVIG